MEEKKYRVRFYMDNIYEVVLLDEEDDYTPNNKSMYIGSLSDCEVWIRLREGGYL